MLLNYFSSAVLLLTIFSLTVNGETEIEPTSLSVTQLRHALKALNIDSSDCLEKKDLVDRLSAARIQPIIEGHPISSSSEKIETASVDFVEIPDVVLKRKKGGKTVKYGKSLTLVGNAVDPTALLVISHGFGDTAEGWRSPANRLAKALPHLLIYLPNAPMQATTVSGGAVMSAWFDIYEFADPRNPTKERRADVEGTLTSARYVSHMAGHVAHKHKIPTNRIIFGGFSQGAAISIAAGLTAPYVPRAVMPLSGFFAAATSVIELAKSTPHLDTLIKEKVPFALFHGDQDPVLPLGLARAGLDKLRGLGLNASIKEYPGMAHTTSESEMKDVVAWLKELTQ